MRFEAYASSSAGNLYAITERDSGRLLIEAGVSIKDIRRYVGFTLSTGVVGCLVSHHHGDHARAVPDLMAAGVDVYASDETWKALGAAGHRRVVLRALVPQSIGGGAFRVLPFDVRHDAVGALGFLVESADGDRLLYACDTAYVPYVFNRLTHIAVECNFSMDTIRQSHVDADRAARVIRYHMGLERVIDMLHANDVSLVREIWLLHLSDTHGDAAAFRDAVERATGKPVYVAPKRINQ